MLFGSVLVEQQKDETSAPSIDLSEGGSKIREDRVLPDEGLLQCCTKQTILQHLILAWLTVLQHWVNPHLSISLQRLSLFSKLPNRLLSRIQRHSVLYATNYLKMYKLTELLLHIKL
ncbi:hypothetical protein PROFUN_13122 [Planoprotostelium fungivorum]|uniref:Uncharacterized protein n=1 Tax=Planoprotostelium fungivorum TaxID=1890364 RepID=A0A2P6N520_9EUKA|nr:hypothetical protein PROFUN_13122 [Planoprotostelium fungivorum]